MEHRSNMVVVIAPLGLDMKNGAFLKWVYPKWMVYIIWEILLNIDQLGYHYLRKPPNRGL